MNKLFDQPSFLQILYLIIFIILFASIIYTPTLINGPVRITEKLIFEEETIEGSLLAVIFIVSILILNLYKREVSKQKELLKKINADNKTVKDRLSNSEHYIGMINVQIQEIKSIFNSIDKYPESKADLKGTFSFFSKRVLGIVNSYWVLIRIINIESQNTIIEHFEIRHGYSADYPNVSNKMVIDKQPISSLISIITNPKNLNIVVSCILPVDVISNEQHIFIQAIINEITKLFVILNSSYYRTEKKVLEADDPFK
jgi:hypothetical protein